MAHDRILKPTKIHFKFEMVLKNVQNHSKYSKNNFWNLFKIVSKWLQNRLKTTEIVPKRTLKCLPNAFQTGTQIFYF